MASKPRSPQSPRPHGGQKNAPNVPAATDGGFSRERILFLFGLREKIANGFYNTDPVLEDLSHSFTKAVDALIA